MKTNEAPEKLYIALNELDEDERTFVLKHRVDYPICTEYTRTDAFIEKAVEFMEKIDDVDEYSWYNEEEHASGITEKCIEDFKNYIKGE